MKKMLLIVALAIMSTSCISLLVGLSDYPDEFNYWFFVENHTQQDLYVKYARQFDHPDVVVEKVLKKDDVLSLRIVDGADNRGFDLFGEVFLRCEIWTADGSRMLKKWAVDDPLEALGGKHLYAKEWWTLSEQKTYNSSQKEWTFVLTAEDID